MNLPLEIGRQETRGQPAYYSEVYARELRKAGVRVDLHLYETGGHAFGVRKQGKDSDRWTEDAIQWLRANEVI